MTARPGPAATRAGVLLAVLSSALGGMAAAATRFVIGATDPVTLAALRFGTGFLCLLPVALALRCRWPPRRDWPAVAGLGLLFFAVFFVVYNTALTYTTAARGALALSTLPLVTMAVAAGLGVRLTLRKTAGVLVATGGVALALGAGLASAPAGAWRGDLIMVGGTLGMALYNVWSRPFSARSSPLGFLTAGMGVGAVALILVAAGRDGFAATRGFGLPQWGAVIYLGALGSALTFYLWVAALQRTTPTRVASTITVNPVTASLTARALLGEPVGPSLLLGVGAVLAGVAIAAGDPPLRTWPRPAPASPAPPGPSRPSA